MPVDFQVMVDKLIRLNPNEILDDGDERDHRVDEAGSQVKLDPKADSKNTSQTNPSSKLLSVRSSKYFVVGSVLLFLKLMTDYLQCAEQVPPITTDVLNRILELLKVNFV